MQYIAYRKHRAEELLAYFSYFFSNLQQILR